MNADWAVSAWHLSSGPANLTPGDFYLLDNEDGTYLVVSRDYLPDNDDVLVRASFLAAQIEQLAMQSADKASFLSGLSEFTA